MNVLFPDHGALCMAEEPTHTLHNLLTLRGALVRDPNVWARYITEAIDRFVDRSDVVFASHHWPTWGRERARGYLELQRDLYAYLHDQTLRMLNKGMVGAEIAEAMQMPPALERAWPTANSCSYRSSHAAIDATTRQNRHDGAIGSASRHALLRLRPPRADGTKRGSARRQKTALTRSYHRTECPASTPARSSSRAPPRSNASVTPSTAPPAASHASWSSGARPAWARPA
jgi:hypothetical protein